MRRAAATADSWSRRSPTGSATASNVTARRSTCSNLNEIEATIERYGIDCDYERNGVIDVATTSHPASYLDALREERDLLRSLGQKVEWLDAEAMRAEVDSPTYTGGLFRTSRAALVDPAKLAWELKRVAEELGVRIYEHTKAVDLDRDGRGVAIRTPLGTSGAPRRSSAPTPTSRCCVGSGSTWCRSTTTAW